MCKAISEAFFLIPAFCKGKLLKGVASAYTAPGKISDMLHMFTLQGPKLRLPGRQCD